MFETELRVPGDPEFVALARTFTLDAATRSLGEERRTPLASAVETAFPLDRRGGSRGSASESAIQIVARCLTHVLEISLIERGVPTDDAYAARDRLRFGRRSCATSIERIGFSTAQPAANFG